MAQEKHAFAAPDRELLVGAAEALYGRKWKARASRDLHQPDPVLTMIDRSGYPVPRRVWPALAGLVRQQVTIYKSMLSVSWLDQGQGRHDFLAELGERLYGRQWKAPMAADLLPLLPGLFVNESDGAGLEGRGLVGVAEPDRKLARMATGQLPIPDPVWGALRQITGQRIEMLESMLPAIEEKIAGVA